MELLEKSRREGESKSVGKDDTRKAVVAVMMHLASLALLAGGLMWISSRFPVADYITNAQRRVTEIEVWGALFHAILFALCNVLLLPGGILAVGAGLFFGLWTGWLLNVAGSVMGAAVSFYLSRKLGRGWVVRRFLHNRRWEKLEQGVKREGWKIVFFSQLHPLFPTSLLNYLYGLTPIRASSCLLWIALGQAPGLFLYAYLGTLAQHGLRLWKGHRPAGMEWIWWSSGLALGIVILIVLARISFRILRDNGGSDEPPSTGAC